MYSNQDNNHGVLLGEAQVIGARRGVEGGEHHDDGVLLGEAQVIGARRGVEGGEHHDEFRQVFGENGGARPPGNLMVVNAGDQFEFRQVFGENGGARPPGNLMVVNAGDQFEFQPALGGNGGARPPGNVMVVNAGDQFEFRQGYAGIGDVFRQPDIPQQQAHHPPFPAPANNQRTISDLTIVFDTAEIYISQDCQTNGAVRYDDHGTRHVYYGMAPSTSRSTLTSQLLAKEQEAPARGYELWTQNGTIIRMRRVGNWDVVRASKEVLRQNAKNLNL